MCVGVCVYVCIYVCMYVLIWKCYVIPRGERSPDHVALSLIKSCVHVGLKLGYPTWRSELEPIQSNDLRLLTRRPPQAGFSSQ